MAVERKFVRNNLDRAMMTEYFADQITRSGYGGLDINRTPMGTQITVYAEKPGIIIGKGGRTIRRLTQEVESKFNMESPQIDVKEVPIPELNAQMMAYRLASALERGWYFRKAGHNMLRQIMGRGALGCEIILSGKLTGPRSRVQKFVEGNILHSGKPYEELVEKGFSVAVKKLGTIGCQVKIIPPGVELPGRFRLIEKEKPEPAEEKKGSEIATAAKQEKESIEEIIEKSEAEPVPQTEPETTAEPETTVEPETAVEPETEPETTAEPETAVEPEAASDAPQEPETPAPPAPEEVEAQEEDKTPGADVPETGEGAEPAVVEEAGDSDETDGDKPDSE